MKTEKIQKLVLCALFVALMTVGAFLRIDVLAVPLTFQVFFTMLAGLLLGGRWGTVSVCVYIVMGLCGIPVFAQGGGLFYLLKPTFGYILGFALGACVTGTIANRQETPGYQRLLTANFVGMGVVYACGLVYFYAISRFYLGHTVEVWPMLVTCLFLPLPGDILNCFVAAFLAKRLIPVIHKRKNP